MFKEALRLDPELEHARLGLREAYKARSGLYRLFLKWVFFMQKHTQGRQWLIIIGIYLAFKFGRVVLAAIHPLLAVPLIVAYLLFAFGSWLASGLGHFLLLKDPVARLSLSGREKLDGLLVGGLFFGGLVLLVLGVTVLPVAFAIFGGVMTGASVPSSLVFANNSKSGRLIFGAITAGVMLAGLVAVLNISPSDGSGSLFNERGSTMIGVAVLGIFGSTWLAMVPSLRQGRED